MSLIYYDFNNSNQRIQAKQKQNLADLIIPEENEDPVVLVGLPSAVNNTQDVNNNDLKIPLIDGEKSRQNLFTDINSMHSPSTNDVNKINQKIDKARKKISQFIK